MKKMMNRYNAKTWIVFIISLLAALFVFPNLPNRIPTHFNVFGAPDNFGSRWTIFLLPGIIFLLQFLAEWTRKYDPKAEAYETFKSQYYNIHFAVALLLFGVEVLLIAVIFGYSIDVSVIVRIATGFLIVYLGNIMPKFKHNYFVGIKTSWTLASEKVWYLTHRFAGKVWVIGGSLMVLSVFLPVTAGWLVFLIVTVLIVLLPLGASFYFFEK